MAQLLGNTLYGRRFMPFYAFNLLCGIDKQGAGCVYGYDAIGSFDKLTYGCQGTGTSMASPLLDNQFIGHNHLVKKLATDRSNVENAAKDIINSIAERDIYTGDSVELCLVEFASNSALHSHASTSCATASSLSPWKKQSAVPA